MKPLHNQVSDWDVQQLNHITHNAHHDEADAHGSNDLEVF